MALAKYYEDIIGRLNDDRASIVSKFKSADFRRLSDKNPDLIRHIEEHLKASAKALNLTLEVITDPTNQASMTMAEAKIAISKNQSLQNQLESSSAKLERASSNLSTTTQERDRLKHQMEALQRDIRTMKKTEKELRQQLKNGASKRR